MNWYRAPLVLVTGMVLQACLANPGVSEAPARSPELAAKRLTGTVTLEAKLSITPHRQLLAVVNPWAATDIDHVRLELFQGATSKGTLTVTQAQLANVVRVNNLVRNTSYTIQARAWQDAGETVPIDNFDVSAASCTTAFSTTSDDVLSLAGGIALRLRDRTFSGLGTGAIAVTPGSVVTGGVESLTQNLLGVVSTLSGATQGYVDGTTAAARFNSPYGLAFDSLGNMYVADRGNNRIRKITPAGAVSTLAGNAPGFADGTGAAASFSAPWGLAIDSADNLYVSDYGNQRIRKVTPAGVVTTLAGTGAAGYADGAGASAQFFFPKGLAVDASGNVYVADSNNNCIRKITSAGVVSTFAGSSVAGYADGVGTAARLYGPYGVAIDTAGFVYVTDFWNYRIRTISPAAVVSTLAGSGGPGSADGTGTAAQFHYADGVTVDGAGNLYVTDNSTHRVRKVTATGVVTTLAGSTQGYADGVGTAAMFSTPQGVAVDARGDVYVSDSGNHSIRRIR